MSSFNREVESKVLRHICSRDKYNWDLRVPRSIIHQVKLRIRSYFQITSAKEEMVTEIRMTILT